MRMACSYYSKSLPNSLAPRRDSRMCVCVGDSTNKGESMHFPQEKTKEEVGREGWGKAER